ncbi:Uncharacterised protein [Mycobacteroides abscessus subsp. abscessus]|nr:Uncharacterised protein [Mycobacteroides abscessus subsp. abscessus]SIL07550.1 Uncharacterised protein [Mycobacteroides abscessus subsp. abscessus]SIM84270.1 Uncharacterised protein [Mycobacteroides abscessus subsp. abscessus]SLI76504.1 Uncharacterised protein [Mycobacteroides abscessus subsp. abscessus]
MPCLRPTVLAFNRLKNASGVFIASSRGDGTMRRRRALDRLSNGSTPNRRPGTRRRVLPLASWCQKIEIDFPIILELDALTGVSF